MTEQERTIIDQSIEDGYLELIHVYDCVKEEHIIIEIINDVINESGELSKPEDLTEYIKNSIEGILAGLEG